MSHPSSWDFALARWISLAIRPVRIRIKPTREGEMPTQTLLFHKRATIVLLGAFIAACGGVGGGGVGFEDSGGGGGSGGSGGGGGSGGSSNRDSGPPVLTLDSGTHDGGTSDAAGDGGTECPLAATLVYVTGEDDDLWSFYPPTLKFTEIGMFNCLSFPTHMTVDRQGNAWVVANGNIYKASTKDATCTAVPTWTPHLQFDDFALTFIGTSNTIDPHLYIMSETKLGLFDVPAGSVTVIGDAPVADALGDMTSNGDGTLYFLWDTDTPTLYNVDPTNASVIKSTPLSPATGGGDQALAYWGGEFYAFENNVIWQYEPTTGAVGTPGSAPLSVTGAGQSTCVPKTGAPPPPPPK
jgi:hypothetical protein